MICSVFVIFTAYLLRFGVGLEYLLGICSGFGGVFNAYFRILQICQAFVVICCEFVVVCIEFVHVAVHLRWSVVALRYLLGISSDFLYLLWFGLGP